MQEVQAALSELWGFGEFFTNEDFVRSQGADFVDQSERHFGIESANDLVELLTRTVWRVNQQVCEVDFSVTRLDEQETRIFRPRPEDYNLDGDLCRLPPKPNDRFKLELTRSELYSLVCAFAGYQAHQQAIREIGNTLVSFARSSEESGVYELLDLAEANELGSRLRDEIGLRPLSLGVGVGSREKACEEA